MSKTFAIRSKSRYSRTKRNSRKKRTVLQEVLHQGGGHMVATLQEDFLGALRFKNAWDHRKPAPWQEEWRRTRARMGAPSPARVGHVAVSTTVWSTVIWEDMRRIRAQMVAHSRVRADRAAVSTTA